MSSVNKAILVGRLGKDPEVKYTNSGQPVAKFSLATDESYKDREGVKQNKTEWHNITVFGKLAENVVAKYLHKGDLIYVEGKIQTRKWEDIRTSTTKYMTEINVFSIQMLQTKPTGESTAPANREPGEDADTSFQPEEEITI